MSPEQRQHAHQQLAPLLAAKPCPICSGRAWGIAEVVNVLPAAPGGALVLGGTVIPVLLVACGVCGYMLHFSAVKLGLAS